MKLLFPIMLASGLLATANSGAAETPETHALVAGPKPAIALVHGAFEDAHVWDGVAAKLQADGYRVLNINLPGRPSKPMAPQLLSLDVYRDTVLKEIDGELHPVVLVGHSFAGISLAAVAEAEPQKIKTLVYLAAFLPRDGESMLSLAQQDRDSKAGPALQVDKQKGMVAISYAARADLFANAAPDGLRKAIPDLILDEPLAPLATPLHLTAARYGKVDKVYIHTALDQVVSPSLQQKMVAATPVRLELTLNSGHTPFLTDVPGLVGAIEHAAK